MRSYEELEERIEHLTAVCQAQHQLLGFLCQALARPDLDREIGMGMLQALRENIALWGRGKETQQ